MLSIALYVLAASHRRRIESQEAGLKYFVLGGFSSAFFLYGIALIYGGTGTTNFDDDRRAPSMRHRADSTAQGRAAARRRRPAARRPRRSRWPRCRSTSGRPTCTRARPRRSPRSWPRPARSPRSRRCCGCSPRRCRTGATTGGRWCGCIAVATLVVGSILAVVQTNVKRMLAYSSISHAGFILVGVEAAGTAPARPTRVAVSPRRCCTCCCTRCSCSARSPSSPSSVAPATRRPTSSAFRGLGTHAPGARPRHDGAAARPGRRAAHLGLRRQVRCHRGRRRRAQLRHRDHRHARRRSSPRSCTCGS